MLHECPHVLHAVGIVVEVTRHKRSSKRCRIEYRCANGIRPTSPGTAGRVEVDRNLDISRVARSIYVVFQARYELVEKLAQTYAS